MLSLQLTQAVTYRQWYCTNAVIHVVTHTNPSIHSFSSTYPRLGHSGSKLGKVLQTCFPQECFSAPKGFTGTLRPDQIYNHSCKVWMGLLRVGCAWKTSKWRRIGSILTRRPKHFDWPLLAQRSNGSTPCFLLMFDLLIQSLRFSLALLWWKLILACFPPRSHSSTHYPELMTIGKGWNVDWLANRKLFLLQASSQQWSGTTPALRLTAHQTACPFFAPFFCHLWTKPWDT